MRYLAFHKPFRVLAQFTPELPGLQQTLADYISTPGVYPAGRLDYDSEGLLLLTDDGQAAHRLTDPKFAHPRTYWVQVEGCIGEDALRRLREGLTIRDYKTRPCTAFRLDPPPAVAPRDPPVRFRRDIPTDWLSITLTEGRNRQVRHMTAAVGLPTLRLIRFAIGDLTLEGLAPGESRPLHRNELSTLRL